VKFSVETALKGVEAARLSQLGQFGYSWNAVPTFSKLSHVKAVDIAPNWSAFLPRDSFKKGRTFGKPGMTDAIFDLLGGRKQARISAIGSDLHSC